MDLQIVILVPKHWKRIGNFLEKVIQVQRFSQIDSVSYHFLALTPCRRLGFQNGLRLLLE